MSVPRESPRSVEAEVHVLGSLLLDAIQKRDVPLLQALALLIAAVYALSNLAGDLLYAALNPRIRYS